MDEPEPVGDQPGASEDRELFEHLIREFDRGREAVEFLESARTLLRDDGEQDKDQLPSRANLAAYGVREALKRLLPPDSEAGRWQKISNDVVTASRRYAAIRGLEGAEEAAALDQLIAACKLLENFKSSEGQNERRLLQVFESRTGMHPTEAILQDFKRLVRQVDSQGVHGSPSLEEVRDYLERGLAIIRTLFAPFQLRRSELDALAGLEDPTEEDAKRLLGLCSTDHHFAYFMGKAITPKWLPLLDPYLDPRQSGGVWAVLYMTERLGADHGVEITEWLTARYSASGSTEVSAAYIAAAAVDCMPESAGILMKTLRDYPQSQWIREHGFRAAEGLDPASQTFEQLAEFLLDPRDESALLGGIARRMLESLVTGASHANADARVSLLCRKLSAAETTRYLLITFHRVGSIEDVSEDEGRGIGLLVSGLMQMVTQSLQFGVDIERILGLIDGLPSELRQRFRGWSLLQAKAAPIELLVNEVAHAIRNREPTGDDVRLIDRIVEEEARLYFDSWAGALGDPPSSDQIGRALASDEVPMEWRRAIYWYPLLPQSVRSAWDTAKLLLESTHPTTSRESYLKPMPRPQAGWAGSPMGKEELEVFEAEEASRRIADWRPSDARMVIARELGRTLEEVVVSQTQKWAVRPLETVALLRHPTYIHHYFEGLARAGQALAGAGPRLVEAISFARTHPWDPIPLGGDDFEYDPTWLPVDDSSVRLIASLAEHKVDLGDRYDDAWGIVLGAARDRERDSSTISPRDDPLETAINRACTKALEAMFLLMSVEFERHGQIREEAFQLLDEALQLEGWDGAEHRAIIAPRLGFLLHVAREWVESQESLLLGADAPDELGQKTVGLALKWGRPNRWLLERHRRSVRKAALSKVENAIDNMLIGMFWELPGYGVDETVDWLQAQEAEMLSDSGEQIARLLMHEHEEGHLDQGIRFWRSAIQKSRFPASLHGFGWWAEVEELPRKDFEDLTLATVEKSENTLDWCVEVAARCAREPASISGLDIIARLLRGRHEPWDRSRIATIGLEALRATSDGEGRGKARRRLRDALTDLGYFDAQDI